jgi:hypothetical protein
MIKTYSEAIAIPDYYERYQYLKLQGMIGEETFGSLRFLNQKLYDSEEWKKFRRKVILRDNGNDMAVDGFNIPGRAIVHHINPITAEDIINKNPKIFDLENVILVSHNTHEAIHYGNESLLPIEYKEREPGDTLLW